MTHNEEVGRALKFYRQERRLTQMDISKRTGIAQSAISDIERGKRHIRIGQMILYAQALGLHLEFILSTPKPTITVTGRHTRKHSI